MSNRRLPAEWEPQDAIILAWPHRYTDWQLVLTEIQKTYLEIIQHITRFEKVILVLPDQAEYDRLQSSLIASDVDIEKLIPVYAEYNDTWLRDTGPLTIVKQGQFELFDYRFNGWGKKFDASLDDMLGQHLLQQLPLKNSNSAHSDIVLEGGSIDSDGKACLITTSQCLLNPNRNPELSHENYESIL